MIITVSTISPVKDLVLNCWYWVEGFMPWMTECNYWSYKLYRTRNWRRRCSDCQPVGQQCLWLGWRWNWHQRRTLLSCPVSMYYTSLVFSLGLESY